MDDAATVHSICYHLMAPAASAVQHASSSPAPAEALAESSLLNVMAAMTTMFTCGRIKLGAVLERWETHLQACMLSQSMIWAMHNLVH